MESTNKCFSASVNLIQMIHVLSDKPSAVSDYVAELRDVELQKDRARFRWNLERIGMAMGMAISNEMSFENVAVQTPLGIAQCLRMKEQPVLATILRAGIPMHQGVAKVFDRADQAFISACRVYENEDHDSFKIALDAVSSPQLTNRVLILTDPMLATGASLIQVLNSLEQTHGNPSEVHIAAAIASQDGLNNVHQALPHGSHIWVGAVDEELSSHGYIVPGLGDAGDLAFGPKS